MPAGELLERIAMAGRPGLERDAGEELARIERVGHDPANPVRDPDLAATAPACRFQQAVVQRRDVDELGRGIEVAERAADGTAVAGLAMADMPEGFMNDGKRLCHV